MPFCDVAERAILFLAHQQHASRGTRCASCRPRHVAPAPPACQPPDCRSVCHAAGYDIDVCSRRRPPSILSLLSSFFVIIVFAALPRRHFFQRRLVHAVIRSMNMRWLPTTLLFVAIIVGKRQAQMPRRKSRGAANHPRCPAKDIVAQSASPVRPPAMAEISTQQFLLLMDRCPTTTHVIVRQVMINIADTACAVG